MREQNDFSEAEAKLFISLGLKVFVDNNINPPSAFRMAAEKAFAYNFNGPNVEALRRGVRALYEAAMYRGEEFDRLISFEEDKTITRE